LIDSKISFEAQFKVLQVPATILRCGLYMEHIRLQMRNGRKNIFTSNFAKNTLVPYVSIPDIGTAAAEIFSKPELYVSESRDLIGELASGRQIMDYLSNEYGQDSFKFRPVNKLWLRLFRPEIFRLSKFYEAAGQSYRSAALLTAAKRSQLEFPGLQTVEGYLAGLR
jgi:hypothetical protein